MTKRRIAAEPRKPWTAAEDATLRQRVPNEPTHVVATAIGRSLPSTFARAHKLGVVKSAEYLASPAAGRTNGRQGMGTRFVKGQTPPNKGLRRPGWGPGRMKATQFKKGAMTGRAQALYQPIGSERVSKDGYLERKTHDALPPDISKDEANRLRQRRWCAVHRIVWEEAHGPLPKGHLVAFKNGDKRDIRVDNLELVSRRDWMMRNTIHNLPKPLKVAIRALGSVNRQIRKRANHAAEKQD
jgi:hypothetical protein